MKYKLLGKEELECVCQFCNKKQIGISFVVECEDGEIKRFGSSCVKKALKITSKEFNAIQAKSASALYCKIKELFPSIGEIGYKRLYRFSTNQFGL